MATVVVVHQCISISKLRSELMNCLVRPSYISFRCINVFVGELWSWLDLFFLSPPTPPGCTEPNSNRFARANNGTAVGSLKMNSSLWKRHLEDCYTALRHRAAHANFGDGLVWICKLLILPPSCAALVLSLNGRNPRGTRANRCSGCIIYAINYGAFNSLMSALVYSYRSHCTVGSLFLFLKTAVWKAWAITLANESW